MRYSLRSLILLQLAVCIVAWMLPPVRFSYCFRPNPDSPFRCTAGVHCSDYSLYFCDNGEPWEEFFLLRTETPGHNFRIETLDCLDLTLWAGMLTGAAICVVRPMLRRRRR